MLNKNPKNTHKQFDCKICIFKCSNKKDYNRHLNTAKHQRLSDVNNTCISNATNTFKCVCGKIYKQLSGLSRHKRCCNHIMQNHNVNTEFGNNDNNHDIVQTMMHLIKQNQNLIVSNQEFKQLLFEQNQTIIELSKKDTTTNNTITNNNQKFNLNVFLNTTCKDAMNMSEFIENMEVQFEDIENIGRDGYVTGMTNMIMSRIKNLEVTKRPMHCTDLKRETIYIKDNNVWEKDDNNTKFHNMIQCIAHKNYAILPAWREKNPDCLNSDTSKFEFCIKMMTNLLGDAGEGQIKLDNKVIRNLSKHIIVDKNTSIVKI
jgi:hypothetical protein